MATGAKSLTGSYGSFALSTAAVMCVVEVAMPSV